MHFLKFPTAIIDNGHFQRFTACEKDLYLLLCRYVPFGEGRRIPVTIPTLAEKCSTTVRSIHRALTRLEKYGYVTRQQISKTKFHFDVHVPKEPIPIVTKLSPNSDEIVTETVTPVSLKSAQKIPAKARSQRDSRPPAHAPKREVLIDNVWREKGNPIVSNDLNVPDTPPPFSVDAVFGAERMVPIDRLFKDLARKITGEMRH
jgi:hypothetical protein